MNQQLHNKYRSRNELAVYAVVTKEVNEFILGIDSISVKEDQRDFKTSLIHSTRTFLGVPYYLSTYSNGLRVVDNHCLIRHLEIREYGGI